MSTATATSALRSGSGTPVVLGERLGGGGEGTVYIVQGRPAVVAKIYNTRLSHERQQKVQAMISAGTPALATITAWPSDLVISGRHAVGFLMPRATQAEEAHVLYGPKSRKQKFPTAGYKFLVHAAMNVARAFATVHQHGIVIGDVNERLAMVGRVATVRLIDCDSFQIVADKQKFLCSVGVQTFTPPELQGVSSFRGVERTAQHDLFGLAVLIFHLLFLGRHPFSGRHHTSPDMTIETAIREHRFAYSVHRQRTLMDAPPNTPLLPSAGTTIAELFEQAFSPATATGSANRPSAAQWAEALQELLSRLVECKENAAHAYVSSLSSCPWCAIELMSSIELFNYMEPAGVVAAQLDVDAIWRAIDGMPALVLAPMPDPNFIKERLGLSPEALLLVKARARQRRIKRADEARVAAERELREQEQLLKEAQMAAAKAHAFVELFESDRAKLSRLEQRFGRARATLARYMRVQKALFWSLAVGVAFLVLGQQANMVATIVFLVCCALGIIWCLRIGVESLARRLADDVGALRASVELGLDHRREQAANAELAVQSVKHALGVAQGKAYQAMVDEREAKAYETVGEVDIQLAKAALAARQVAASRKHSEATAQYQAVQAELARARPKVRDRKDEALKVCQQIRDIEARRVSERRKAREKAREVQFNDYLDQFFIAQEEWPRIPKTVLAALSSYGIETAADIAWDAVESVPGFGEVRTRMLLDWRLQKAANFRFDPNRSDNTVRVQTGDRRLNLERRQQERLLTKVKGQLDAMAAPLYQRKAAFERVMEDAARYLAQTLADREPFPGSRQAPSPQTAGQPSANPRTTSPKVKTRPKGRKYYGRPSWRRRP